VKIKIVFDVLHQRPSRAAHELRYSDLEVKYYVFGLKCLVPEPLWMVSNAG
jgi:hypothetical protein